ncbi:MAG: AmmeMemoRadiSam system radical SAM enzyme [Bacillota bacterium]
MEARHWHLGENGELLCRLCPRGCRLAEGATGACRTRRVEGGRLVAVNYRQCSSYALDPIEKKPLYHFHPGSTVLSLGTVGCNLSCRFCQNWEISQQMPPTVSVEPATVVGLSRQAGAPCIGLAYTYSEPTVWFEFIMDTATMARKQGLANVMVTNGYINPEPLAELLEVVDAFNVDVKAFTRRFYREICSGELEPVVRAVEQIVSAGRHLEITTLLVTGLNDSPEEIRDLVAWLAELNPEIPLHFSGYFPNYRMELPPTPTATLERAYRQARERLSFVYVGNTWSREFSDTHCPKCGALLVRRRGFSTEIRALERGRCGECRQPVPIIT